MRLKKHTDYALRVLMFLSAKGNDPTTIKEIAQTFEVSQNHLMKVVQQLGQLGYVHTLRGKNGGLWLGKPADQIKIGKVLRDTGEANELAECFVNKDSCRITPVCQLKHVFDEANQAFFKVLDGYSLADILEQPGRLQAMLGLERQALA